MFILGPSELKAGDWRGKTDKELLEFIGRLERIETKHPPQRERLQEKITAIKAELERRQRDATPAPQEDISPEEDISKAWLAKVGFVACSRRVDRHQ